MRYLRMLSNSITAASLGSAYVLVLVLQLNPQLRLDVQPLASLAQRVGLFYAVHLTVFCYVLLVLRQIFAREPYSPGWLSVGIITSLGTLLAAAGGALMFANVETFRRVLDAQTVSAMTRGAAALEVSAVLFAVLGWARRGEPVERRVLWTVVLMTVGVGSVAAPLAFRGAGARAPLQARPIDALAAAERPGRGARRVQVIGIDGGSLDFVARVAAEGRLPNFGRLLDAGAVMHLATVHPTSAETVWAALVTGKLPLENGVRSAGGYRLPGGALVELLPDYCFSYELVRLGFLVDEAHTSATLRTRALWSILSTEDVSVGAVGWPLSEPAPVVRGYIVSARYVAAGPAAAALPDPPGVYPPDVARDVAVAVDQAAEADVVGAPVGALEKQHAAAARTDRIAEQIQSTLGAALMPQVTMTRFQSLDPIGHYFLRYAMPAAFGEVADEQHRQLQSVLERHYAFVDEAIGRAIRALGPDDLLLVVSGFGMEPIGLVRRLVERVVGDPDLSGTHDAAPDGFVLAYGSAVAPGRVTTRASVVDIAPTLLYFLGLPVGRDMDGYVRTDLFQRSFTDERPITFIPTYDR